MPSPEERERLCDAENFKSPSPDPKIEKLMEDATKRLVQEVKKQRLADACAKQCLCTALYTNALCPIHGPNYVRHLINRKE